MSRMEQAGLRTRTGEPVLLEGVKATGELKGGLLEMAVEQRFRNPTDRNVEVVYTFPLPWRAVLLGVEVVLGDKRLAGTVVPKAEAEAKYEETLSSGDAAVMLETNRDESYTLNLGNLAAGETCVVTLRYGQVLAFEQGGLRLLLPTVIAPRYGDPVRDGGLRPHQVSKPSLEVEYPFDLTLRLHSELARARVASPSHPIAVALGDAVVTVTLARRGALDRDFVLIVDRLAHDGLAVVAPDTAVPGTHAAVVSFRPRIPMEEQPAVAVNILVDCSGSMNGDSIDAARRALAEVVAQLGEHDRFSLSRFGSTVEHRSRGLWKVADASRSAAKQWLAGLAADMGGTEMEAALQSTFALSSTVPCDVLLITDGEISAVDSLIATAIAAERRIFVVGIGSSPAEAHLRRLAEATGGACDFVAPGEAVAPAVLRMFHRLHTPRLAGIELAWPAGTEVAWQSPLPRAVFDGDTVTVFAQLRQRGAGEIRLLGRAGDDAPVTTVGCAQLGDDADEAANVPRMVGAARVRTLLTPVGAADANEVHRREARDLAVRYQLVSAQTNFLLLHERAEADRAKDMPELHQVRPMLAAGWGGTGTVLGSLPAEPMVYEDLDVPAVVRLSRSAPALSKRAPVRSGDGGEAIDACRCHFAQPEPSFDLEEIPAFLRRRDDNPPTVRLRSAPHWSDDPAVRGFTPFGFRQWLREVAPAEHPRCFSDLLTVGVCVPVVEWLRTWCRTSGGTPHSEAEVVAAFVLLMTSDEILPMLGTPTTASAAIGAAVRRVKVALKGKRQKLAPHLAALVVELQGALIGMTAERWGAPVEPVTT